MVEEPVEYDVFRSLSEGQSAPVRFLIEKPTTHLFVQTAQAHSRCDEGSALPLFFSAGCCLAPMLVLVAIASQRRPGFSLSTVDFIFAWLMGMIIGVLIGACMLICCCGRKKSGASSELEPTGHPHPTTSSLRPLGHPHASSELGPKRHTLLRAVTPCSELSHLAPSRTPG